MKKLLIGLLVLGSTICWAKKPPEPYKLEYWACSIGTAGSPYQCGITPNPIYPEIKDEVSISGYSNPIPSLGGCECTQTTKDVSDEYFRYRVFTFNYEIMFYRNKNKEIQKRYSSDIWDETSQSWRHDPEYFEYVFRLVFKQDTQQIYGKYCTPNKWLPWKYHKLTSNQQAELGNYCDALEDIITDKDTTSTELPKKPDWLN